MTVDGATVDGASATDSAMAGASVETTGGVGTLQESGDGNQAVVGYRLNTLPKADVTITLSVHPGFEYDATTTTLVTLSQTSMTFTPQNYGTWQYVTVTAVNDASLGDRDGHIRGTTTGPGSGYAGRSVAAMRVKVDDSADTAPSFGFYSMSEYQVFEVGKAVDLTLPGATGGNGTLTYSLLPVDDTFASVPDGPLPEGLSFDGPTRKLSGTPTTAQGSKTYRYKVRDEDDDSASFTFQFRVIAAPAPADATPSFAADASIASQSYTAGTAIDSLTLPEATGGDGTLTYAITPALPAGLDFNAATRVLSGTPAGAQEAAAYTYKATGGDAANPDSAALTFTITVEPAPEPEQEPETTPNASGLAAAEQNGAAVLTWTPGTDSGISAQRVKRREAKQDWATVAEVSGGAATHTDDGVAGGKRYIYRIESWSGDGRSLGVSEPVSITIPAETTPNASGLAATEQNGAAVLTWTPGDDSGISKQRVKRREPKQDWATVAEVAGDAATYTDDGVAGGKRYIYRIESWSGDGRSLGVSEPARITMPAEPASDGDTSEGGTSDGGSGASGASDDPAALEGLTVSPVSGETTKLAVSWNSVTGVDKYLVQWKTGSADYNSGDTVTTTSHTITGLTADTAYTVQVSAIDTDADPDAELAVGEASGTTNASPPANTPATGAPTISGTAQVGETLTAATSGIGDADGLANATFSYQWLAGGSDISGATGSAYTPVAGEVGKAIKVRVSFTDDAGNAEALTSAATAAVVAEDPPPETPAVSFVIYHDPEAGDAAVDRYKQGVKVLTDAGIAYTEVKGDVQAEVDRLAGVTDSVLPRFFLGDPTEEGWVSEPRENNGGLRWLKGKVAELDGD